MIEIRFYGLICWVKTDIGTLRAVLVKEPAHLPRLTINGTSHVIAGSALYINGMSGPASPPGVAVPRIAELTGNTADEPHDDIQDSGNTTPHSSAHAYFDAAGVTVGVMSYFSEMASWDPAIPNRCIACETGFSLHVPSVVIRDHRTARTWTITAGQSVLVTNADPGSNPHYHHYKHILKGSPMIRTIGKAGTCAEKSICDETAIRSPRVECSNTNWP